MATRDPFTGELIEGSTYDIDNTPDPGILQPGPVPPPPPQPEEGEFTKGLRRGVGRLYETTDLLQGQVAAGLGYEDAAKEQLQQAQQVEPLYAANAPKIARIEDAQSVDDLVNWAKSTVGEQLPNLAATLAAGSFGRLVGGILGAGRAGMATGVYGTAAGLESGQIFKDVTQDPTALQQNTMQELAGKAAVGGTAAGALEGLSAMRIFNKLGMPSVGKRIVSRALREAGNQAALEAGTEGAQTLIERATHQWANENYDILGPEGYSEILNAMAGGALVGSLTGSVTGMTQHGVREPRTRPDPLQDMMEDIEAQDEVDAVRRQRLQEDGFEVDELAGGPELVRKARIYDLAERTPESFLNAYREKARTTGLEPGEIEDVMLAVRRLRETKPDVLKQFIENSVIQGILKGEEPSAETEELSELYNEWATPETDEQTIERMMGWRGGPMAQDASDVLGQAKRWKDEYEGSSSEGPGRQDLMANIEAERESPLFFEFKGNGFQGGWFAADAPLKKELPRGFSIDKAVEKFNEETPIHGIMARAVPMEEALRQKFHNERVTPDQMEKKLAEYGRKMADQYANNTMLDIDAAYDPKNPKEFLKNFKAVIRRKLPDQVAGMDMESFSRDDLLGELAPKTMPGLVEFHEERGDNKKLPPPKKNQYLAEIEYDNPSIPGEKIKRKLKVDAEGAVRRILTRYGKSRKNPHIRTLRQAWEVAQNALYARGLKPVGASATGETRVIPDDTVVFTVWKNGPNGTRMIDRQWTAGDFRALSDEELISRQIASTGQLADETRRRLEEVNTLLRKGDLSKARRDALIAQQRRDSSAWNHYLQLQRQLAADQERGTLSGTDYLGEKEYVDPTWEDYEDALERLNSATSEESLTAAHKEVMEAERKLVTGGLKQRDLGEGDFETPTPGFGDFEYDSLAPGSGSIAGKEKRRLEIAAQVENFIAEGDKVNAKVEQPGWARRATNGYEVSSKGDKRFSALVARLKDGRTIEQAYQLDVKGYRNKGYGPGDVFKKNAEGKYVIKGQPPVNGKSEQQTWDEYLGLWRQWAVENPQLMQDLLAKSKGKPLTDMFANTSTNSARALSIIRREMLNEESVAKPEAPPVAPPKAPPGPTMELKQVANILRSENYDALNTPADVLSFARGVVEIRDKLKAAEKAGRTLSDAHIDLLIRVEGMLKPDSPYDWEMLFDGTEFTTGDLNALDQILGKTPTPKSEPKAEPKPEPKAEPKLLAKTAAEMAKELLANHNAMTGPQIREAYNRLRDTFGVPDVKNIGELRAMLEKVAKGNVPLAPSPGFVEEKKPWSAYYDAPTGEAFQPRVVERIENADVTAAYVAGMSRYETSRRMVSGKNEGGGDKSSIPLEEAHRLRKKFEAERAGAVDPRKGGPLTFEARQRIEAEQAQIRTAAEKARKAREAKGDIRFSALPGYIEQAVTDGLTPVEDAAVVRDQQTLEAWSKALGLTDTVLYYKRTHAASLLSKAMDWDNLQSLARGTLHGFMVPTTKGTVVYVDEALKDTALRTQVLAHEVGHTVFKQHLLKADSMTQMEIRTAFEKWRKSVSGATTVGDVLADRKTKEYVELMAVGHLKLGKLKTEVVEYYLDFEEWFADQVAKQLSTPDSTQPQGVVARFFWQVAQAIKTLFGLAKEQGYPADAAVSQFIHRIQSGHYEAARRNLFQRAWKKATKREEPIRLAAALHAKDPWSPAARVALEFALHGESSPFTAAQRQALGRAFTSDYVLRQLRKHVPNVQATNIYPNIAMGYQLWLAGELDLGPQAEQGFRGIYKRLRDEMRGTVDEEVTEEVFKSIRDAKLDAYTYRDSEGEHIRIRGGKGWIVPPKAVTDKVRLTKTGKALNQLARGYHKVFKYAYTANGRLYATGVPSLIKLARHFQPRTGEESAPQGYLEARTQFTGRWTDQFGRLIEGFTEEEKADALQTLQNRNIPATSPRAAELVKRVHALFKHMFVYMNERGLPVLETKGGYFPWVFDRKQVLDREGELRQLLSQEKYTDDFARIGKKWGSTNLQKDEDGNTYEVPFTPEEVIEMIINHLVVEEYGDTQPHIHDIGNKSYQPFFQQVNTRILYMIEKNPEDMAVLQSFFKPTLEGAVVSYISHMVKRAEYYYRFGSRGSAIHELLKEAEREGATPAQIKLAEDYVKAMLGTYGHDTAETLQKYFKIPVARNQPINPKLQQALSTVIVLKNWAVLGLATITSLGDPVGIFVRSGDFQTAWQGVKEGFRESFNKGNKWEMAEALGVIESYTNAEALNEFYGHTWLNTSLRAWNDKFFQIIGLDWWTRVTRMQAFAAGLAFLKKHTLRPNKHSDRYMAELYLRPGDVQFDNGEIKILSTSERAKATKDERDRDDRVRAALARFVDEAILRPNAAQRPILASDPHMMLFWHLKSFTWSFYDRVLRRVAHEIGEGNYAAFHYLTMLVPVMMVGELSRSLTKGDDDDRDVSQVIWDAIQRSGMLGLGGLVIDAAQDRQMGGYGIESFLNPHLDTLKRLDDLFLNADEGTGEAAARQIPFWSVWKGWGDGK